MVSLRIFHCLCKLALSPLPKTSFLLFHTFYNSFLRPRLNWSPIAMLLIFSVLQNPLQIWQLQFDSFSLLGKKICAFIETNYLILGVCDPPEPWSSLQHQSHCKIHQQLIYYFPFYFPSRWHTKSLHHHWANELIRCHNPLNFS